ncbi:MAG: hypothetical protein ABF322_10125 [Lentimonas sp.]
MERLGDGNAIFIRGAGNVIRRNYVHHILAPIRTGRREDGYAHRRKIDLQMHLAGHHAKVNNRFENNIVADIIAPPHGNYLVLREGLMTGATIQLNILYSMNEVTTFISEMNPEEKKTEDHRGRTIARVSDVESDYNISDPKLGEDVLSPLQAEGVDTHSLSNDPMFVDPANKNFLLKPDSPVLKLGFVPLDLSQLGLIDSPKV